MAHNIGASAGSVRLSPRMLRQEAPYREEVIKCVVVGDCGVGKTKLVCFRACRTFYTLAELVKPTRIHTVWAIDHYARDVEVVEQARCTVDGTPVHLRLWDTFGYHDKDRWFAYDGADVIVLCFSLVRPRTLANVLSVWYPEAQRFGSRAPAIVVGCQADLRYLRDSKAFQSMAKNCFSGGIPLDDVIQPDAGRAVAASLGLPYYETSVLTGFGVDSAFDNAIRAALRHRSSSGMLGQHFKRVHSPLPQAPECPPQPEAPPVVAPRQLANACLSDWLLRGGQAGLLSDSIFICQGIPYHCHRIVVSAGCPTLKDLLCASTQPFHAQASIPPSLRNQVDCLEAEATGGSGCATAAFAGCHLFRVVTRCTHTSELLPCPACSGLAIGKVVVTVDESISSETFSRLLHFLYAGEVVAGRDETDRNLAALKELAVTLGVPELAAMCAQVSTLSELSSQAASRQTSEQFIERRAAGFRELGIKERLFADVAFQLEDGSVRAHRILLAAQCDVLSAMFCSSFKDSTSRYVPLPNFTVATFVALLDVLYASQCSVDMKPSGYVSLITLANLFCLPRVVAASEDACVRKLCQMHSLGHDTVAAAISIMEVAEFHNASQLSEWCRHHLSVNYVTCYNRHHEALAELSSANQQALARSRWPPLWYLRELDHYEKQMRALRAAAAADLVRIGCFGSKSRRKHSKQLVSSVIVG